MQEKTVNSRVVYRGRILALEVLEVELADGARAVREVVRHQGAVAAVARGADGRFVLVRQYRKPLERIMTEVVAGILEPGEDPEHCVRREIEEETGLRAGAVHRLGRLHPSPGYLDEEISVFAAEVAPAETGRKQDPDERVVTLSLAAEEIDEWIRTGRITDAKTVACWHLYRTGAAGREGAAL